MDDLSFSDIPLPSPPPSLEGQAVRVGYEYDRMMLHLCLSLCYVFRYCSEVGSSLSLFSPPVE